MPHRSSIIGGARVTTGDFGQDTKSLNARSVEGVNLSDSFSRPPAPSSFTFNVKNMSNNDGSYKAGSKMSISSRRQSTGPMAKAPLGPRPLDLQKRSVSGSMGTSFSSIRHMSTITPHNPYSNSMSVNDIPQFDFPSIDPMMTIPQPKAKDPDAFLGGAFVEPNFDFDAFHDNIIAASPRLESFPRSPAEADMPEMPAVPKFETAKFPKNPAIPILARKGSGAGNVVRKSSTASTASRLSGMKVEASNQAGNTTSMLRGRRQTHFPPNAFNNMPPTTKAPRKSVGPGTFVAPDVSEGTTSKQRPVIHERKSSIDSTKPGLSPALFAQAGASGRDDSKSPRIVKSKSILIPNRPVSKDLLTPSKTPEGTRTASMGNATTPNRRSGTPGRTTTPGAHGRRSSVATGLGARTISPTDARRLKRLSMVPPAPPLPQQRISQAPPTPQPEIITPVSAVPITHSPAPIHRKSMTPSSSRTTPDPNRKSYSSGQSLSSSTSYSSNRNLANTAARLSRDVSTSRLPTPKPRVETGSTPEVEEIPPVPAIPKSYESPASELEQPYFSARSSSLQLLDTPTSDSPISGAAEAFAKLNIPPDFFASSYSSQHSDGESRPTNSRKTSEKSETSSRLPPMNFPPLSTPTTEKIRQFKDSAGPRMETPPDARHQIKTPSTPMTASKASFFPKLVRTQSEIQSAIPRSNTSHFVLRSDTGFDDHSPHLPVFAFEADTTNLRSVSPFLSTSAPKDGIEFPNYMRANIASDFKRASTQTRPNGPRAPSYSISGKSVSGISSADGMGHDVASTLATLIPRSISKERRDHSQPESRTSSEDISKYNGMPPPKLPASATWSNLTVAGPSPTQQKSGFFRSRRKTSTSSTAMLSELEKQISAESSVSKSQSSIGRPSIDSTKSLMVHTNRSASLLASGLAASKSNDTDLDRDDLIAEEEMKKLASKRRDFESAARELDALRARARAVPCISPTAALQTSGLNIFERGEVVDFPNVFFTGTKNAKKVIGDLSASSSNFGYDDDRGDYNIVNGDHLAYRYEVVDLLGKGSFGQVVRCVDHKTGLLVAIKIIRNKKRFHQQALVEVDILQKLKEWDPDKKYNVVNFDQNFYFRGHLCISTDLLNMNLYEFIKAHDFRGFSLKLIRRFTKQMLASLVLLHGKKVIHCDLKPENILLAHPAHSDIKVIDFGSSCFENEKVYTYIQSRFYRSPEVILGMSYGMPIDMWSLGCILAELYTGYPIFPGENEQEQLACIMEIFGPPEKHLIEKSSRKKLFFDSMGKPRLTVSSKGRRRRPSTKELRSALKCDDEAFLDFITKCLRWDPMRRMTPHEANRHEFITGFKAPTVSARKHIASAISTPLKRGTTTAVGATRPLPQPPSANMKPTIGARHDSLAPSPNKPAARRQSNVGGFQAAAQAKRASHVAMNPTSNPNLGRITSGQRTASSRSDLATAAAAASLVK